MSKDRTQKMGVGSTAVEVEESLSCNSKGSIKEKFK